MSITEESVGDGAISAAAPKPYFPFGHTQSGKHLEPRRAVETAIIHYRRTRYALGASFRHEIFSDLAAASSIALLYYKANSGDVPPMPEDIKHVEHSVRSLLFSSPILATLGVKWFLAAWRTYKLSKIYNKAVVNGVTNDDLLERLLSRQGLLLEALPDDIDPERDFNEKRAAAGLWHSLKSTPKELGQYFNGKAGLGADVWRNVKRTWKSTTRYGANNIAHAFHALAQDVKHPFNKKKLDATTQLETNVGHTVLSAAWSQTMAGFQFAFICNEAKDGAAYFQEAFNTGSLSDAVLGTLHALSALLSVKPFHELLRSSNHAQGQLGGIKARLGTARYKEEELLRKAEKDAKELAEATAERERLERIESQHDHHHHPH